MSIEAMKLALEALSKTTKEMFACRDELAERGARPETNKHHQKIWDSAFNAYSCALNAAEKLRAAIEQAERQEIEPDRDWVENDGCPTEKAVLQRFWREHQQAEKQEPVAWMYDWWDESEDLDGVPTGGEICDCITKDYDEAHSPTNGCHNIRSLYTAPPQREWQGLTDEEIDRALETTLGLHTFARAIEAKLKEKNT
jgi:hypothetical protein